MFIDLNAFLFGLMWCISLLILPSFSIPYECTIYLSFLLVFGNVARLSFTSHDVATFRIYNLEIVCNSSCPDISRVIHLSQCKNQETVRD